MGTRPSAVPGGHDGLDVPATVKHAQDHDAVGDDPIEERMAAERRPGRSSVRERPRPGAAASLSACCSSRPSSFVAALGLSWTM